MDYDRIFAGVVCDHSAVFLFEKEIPDEAVICFCNQYLYDRYRFVYDGTDLCTFIGRETVTGCRNGHCTSADVQYCTGTGERNNFCWWIERGLQPLGYYFPGSSRTYQIYWKKSTQEYSKHGFIKDFTDDDAAMKEVAQKLSNLVNQKNLK